MKVKLVLLFVTVAVLFSLSSVSFADQYKRGSEDDYPGRILAYVVHPFGMALEYAVTRPVHWITKQTELNKVFGSDNTFEDKSFVWE